MEPAPEQTDTSPPPEPPPAAAPSAAWLSPPEKLALALTLAMLASIAIAFLLRATTGELRALLVDAGRPRLYDLALVVTLLALIVPLTDLIARQFGHRPLLNASGQCVGALVIAWVVSAAIFPSMHNAQRLASDEAAWTRTLDLPARTISSSETPLRSCASNPLLPYRGSSPPPWPGRTALPVDGSDAFVADVQQVLDTLAAYAPLRYRETLEYLPQADLDPVWLDVEFGPGQAAAASNGKFAIDADDYGRWQFTRVFLHEVGHNVRQHLTIAYEKQGLPEDERDTLVERNADEYAATVLAEIDACHARAGTGLLSPSR